MNRKVKVNFKMSNSGLKFGGAYMVQEFGSTDTLLDFGTGDRSADLEEHQHYTFFLVGGVWQASVGFSVCSYDVHVLEPAKAGAFDLDNTTFSPSGIDLMFRIKEFSLDLSDYGGKYKTNLTETQSKLTDWIDNHSSPKKYHAIVDLAFSISSGSALGYDAVWGKIDQNGVAAPLPDHTGGLETDPKDSSVLKLRTVSALLNVTGSTVEVSGYPGVTFDSTTPLKIIRGTSFQISASK